ncbi:MAG: beta-lactamase family protein [Candidatus Krumholzibacteriota bacterium]|nr:beta-lactamase family protein [Candidatus Krumholzibacteriota bacterium]
MRALVKLAVVVLSVLSAVQASAGELPETQPGRRAGEMIALLNGESSLDLDDYIKNQYSPGFRDAFPIASHKSMIRSTQAMFGRLKVADISESGPDKISVVLKDGNRDAWLNLIIEVEPEEPYRIVSMGLMPGSRPDDYKETESERDPPEESGNKAGEKQERSSGFSNLEELELYLREMERKNEFSGTVLIARDGNPLFQQAYGYASKRFKVPNKLDTKINLGSCNKVFTSIAIVQLMEKGKLSLDDPIGKYLDIFPEKIAKGVTIRHLLNMRSGWGDYWSNDNFINRITQLRSVSEYMQFIKDIPLDFEPGTNFQHSNTGFIVAGAIIEAVSGMDYYDYIRKNIYEPAGMENSDSFDKDGPVQNLAMGYTNMNRADREETGYRWNNMYSLPPRGTPTGGGYSTVEDLLKFDKALRNFKLLSPGYTGYFLNRFEGTPGDSFSPPNRPYRFAGGAPGISSFVAMDFERSYSVIVLSNYDFPVGIDVGKDILEMLEIR